MSKPPEHPPSRFSINFYVDNTALNRWILPLAFSALLLGILLFLFQYNTGDSSINSPLGIALIQTWTAAIRDGSSFVAALQDGIAKIWPGSLVSASETQDYSYCLLVPLMLGYLLWVKRQEIVRSAGGGETWAILPVFAGLALFWIGSRAGKQYVGCIGIQLIVASLVIFFWGRTLFRKLLFPWAILAFAWPLPFLDTAVAFPMRMIVSTSAHFVLNVVGIPCYQSGTALYSAPTAASPLGARFQIDIADPCSGLHSLLPLLMFSAFYTYFFLNRRWHQWLVFLSAFVFTIVGNIVRILLLVFGCLAFGSAFAIGTNDEPSSYHEDCGFVVFAVVLGLECLLGYLLGRYCDSKSAPPAAAHRDAPAPLSPAVPALWRDAVVGGVVLLMLGVFFITPPVYLPTEAGVVMSSLPDEVIVPGLDGGHFFGTRAEVTEAEHLHLPPDTEFSRKNYDDFHDHNIFFSIVLSGVQQYTIHPPEVCLVAQGWSIVGHEDVPITLQSGHRLYVENLSLQRDALVDNNVHRVIKAYYMYWYVADGITTQSHFKRNWISSWDRVVHNRDHRWAYVIAMSTITDSYRADGMDADETKEMLKNFIRQIVPTVQKDELTATAANP